MIGSDLSIRSISMELVISLLLFLVFESPQIQNLQLKRVPPSSRRMFLLHFYNVLNENFALILRSVPSLSSSLV